MPEHQDPGESDIAALERFIVENDDLLQLEELVGRLNIFDALGISRVEIRHSNFLSWLLDPTESHGQGDLFLKAFLMDLVKHARHSGFRVPISAIELDGAELRGVEVWRERWRIDLLILCREPAFVVAIENKVDSGEHSGQLKRYEESVRRELAQVAGSDGSRAMFVFLTPSGSEASDDDWMAYSYAQLFRVFARVRRAAAGSLGADVGVFVDHYLNLIGSRMMDDPSIEELCRRIYQNHRRAIDLLVERVGPTTSGVTRMAETVLRDLADQWVVRSVRASVIHFVPISWLGALAGPDGHPPEQAPANFFLELQVNPAKAHLRVIVGPARDPLLRKRIIERLLLQGNRFGFAMKKKNVTDVWTRVYAKTFLTWDEDADPSFTDVSTALKKVLADLGPRLVNVPQAVADVVNGNDTPVSSA